MPTYHSLPNLEGYRSKAARTILKLAREHTEKQRELSAIGRQLEEARSALPEAIAKDTQARALAARKGEEDPGRVHENETVARIEDLTDKYRVAERVVADVERDLSETITHSKAELMDEARAKREEANEAFTETKRKMRELHDQQRHHAGVVRWAHTAAAHFSPPPPDMHVLSVPDRLEDEDPEKPPEVVSAQGAPSVLRSA